MIKKILLLIALFSLLSCLHSKDTTDDGETKSENDTIKVINEKTDTLSPRRTRKRGSEQQNGLTGLIEIGENDRICISQNPETRSRKRYYVDPESQEQLREHVGKYARVSAEVTKEYSSWKYEIKVLSIISIE